MRYDRIVRRIPVMRSVAFLAYRVKVAGGYFVAPLKELGRWLVQSRETTNFTYNLTPLNQRYLAALIADVLEVAYETVVGYITELERDAELRAHIRAMTLSNGQDRLADSEARFGRRAGWYAIARVLKPQVVVETGVDKGLGSCVLAAALIRNAEEGYAGYYYGTDINPRAGYLLSGKYGDYGEILYGDSIASLRQLDRTIDLFINDSNHAPDYEKAEYETVAPRLSADALVLGDNSHWSEQLLTFALATGRRFAFFHEVPQRHWYPGGGIGIAFRRK